MTPTITQSDIMTALRSFLTGLDLTGAPVAPATTPSVVAVQQAQQNRDAEPGVPDFVLMTPLSLVRLSTNRTTYADPQAQTPPVQQPGSRSTLQPTQVTVQLDVHGPNSMDNAQTIATLFRDDYACESFAASGFDIAPLYTSDPRQAPFIDAEQQYEYRWSLDAVMQSNAIIVTPQQFADVLTVQTVNVDAAYPAGLGPPPSPSTGVGVIVGVTGLYEPFEAGLGVIVQPVGQAEPAETGSGVLAEPLTVVPVSLAGLGVIAQALGAAIVPAVGGGVVGEPLTASAPLQGGEGVVSNDEGPLSPAPIGPGVIPVSAQDAMWGGFTWDSDASWSGQVLQMPPASPSPGDGWVLPNGPALIWDGSLWDTGVVWS